MKSRFREIEEKLPATVDAAVKEAAERIAARAKAAAPVRTGRLKASIDTRAAPEEATGRATGGYRRDVVAVWYWFLAEFGHEAGGPGPKGGTTGKAAPHPFMVPAAEAERPVLVADIKRRLGGL